jgi:hypothetical protein
MGGGQRAGTAGRLALRPLRFWDAGIGLLERRQSGRRVGNAKAATPG